MLRRVAQKDARTKTVTRVRAKIREMRVYRLSVHRSLNHIYAQVFSPCGSKVVAAASSLEALVKSEYKGPGKVKIAEAVGRLVAERAMAKQVDKVAFDRSGFKYHGRVKALAEGARLAGLNF